MSVQDDVAVVAVVVVVADVGIDVVVNVVKSF